MKHLWKPRLSNLLGGIIQKQIRLSSRYPLMCMCASLPPLLFISPRQAGASTNPPSPFLLLGPPALCGWVAQPRRNLQGSRAGKKQRKRIGDTRGAKWQGEICLCKRDRVGFGSACSLIKKVPLNMNRGFFYSIYGHQLAPIRARKDSRQVWARPFLFSETDQLPPTPGRLPKSLSSTTVI